MCAKGPKNCGSRVVCKEVRYMETNSGVFPKASHIQNEVGGSWYTVKKILHNIKEKILGTPKLENHNNVHALTPAKETTSLAPMTSHPPPDNRIELHDHPKTLVHADQVLQTQDKDGNIGHSTSNEAGESSSTLTVDIAASAVTDMRNFSPCELQIPTTAEGTKSGSHLHASEADASENVKVYLTRKCYSESIVQLNAVTDSLQLELDNQHLQPKESVSNVCETSDGSLVSNSKKFSHFRHDKLIFKGCGAQQENRTLPCGLSPNSSVEISTQSALSDTSQTVSRLAEIFEKLTDDAAVAEAKNGNMECQESLSNILLSCEKDRNSQAKSQLSTDILLPSESIAVWQDHHVNKPVSNVSENQRPRKEMIASSLKENVTPSMAESFTGSNNLMGLDDLKGNTKRVHSFFEHTEKPMPKAKTKRSELKDLIEYIKGRLPGEPSNARASEKISCKTDDNEKRKLDSKSLPTLQSFDKKERYISAECCAVHGKSKDDDSIKALPVGLRTQGDETSRPDYNKPRGHAQIAVLSDKKELNDRQQKLFIMEEPNQNKAIVKFLLKTTQKNDIVDAFQQCGDILKVEILSTEKSFYGIANIYFKTREGLQNALQKTDMLVRNVNITVEAAGSQEDISNRISIPSLIGDPSVPVGLVKNPTRTVKITQLTCDISSHDVVAALASCGVNVTGFFLGTLKSVAYVEFETEDDKEIALANSSIYILGKQLLIYRIDAPRTTVVRILHHSIKENKVIQVCKSLGKIRSYSMRHPGVTDVHFKLAEWPNMIKILNRLNGAKVDGHTLLAQPASVFPPDILRTLWSQPGERKYVKTVVQKLLQKLGENVVDKV